jgi:hypothetical protein
MPIWNQQGRHRYYREGDLLFFELHGEFTLADTECMVAQTAAIGEEHGYALIVFDARDGLNMTPEARRYINEVGRQRSIESHSLIIGAPLAMRIMTRLILNAASLFGKQLPPVEFVESTAEVAAWLAAQRQAGAAQT